MRPRPRHVVMFCSVFGVTLIVLQFMYANGYFVNLSDSAPIGVWKRIPDMDVQVGDWALVCPQLTYDEIGVLFSADRLDSCSENRECECPEILKRVVALPGDIVAVDADGWVETNGFRVHALRLRPDGVPLPILEAGLYWTRANEIWVLNPHVHSVDSRYFGPVSRDAVLSGAEPLFARISIEEEA